MNNTAFRLLPSLQFTPHISSGRRWYAVEDPQSGRFLKLGTAEYLVASGLQNSVAPAQIIEVLETNGFDNAKERVTSTISWLAKQGLLISETNRTAEPPGDESTKPARPIKPLATPSLNIDPFFIRLPLLSGPLAERLAKPFQWLVSWPCGLALLALLATALLAVANGSERFWSLNEKLFVEDGRLWWLAAWFVLKCVHEMGHAVAGVSTGSRIRSAGLHFIFMAPVPYVDVTDMWRVTSGRQRMLVSAAGMLAEIATASIAVLVAFNTTNLQLQYFCAAVATLGTITTVAFNGNPLMKFDGYYILSDYLSRPNLWTEAQTAASGLIKRVLNPFAQRLGLGTTGGGLSLQGATHAGLTAFGLTTMFYRFVMLGTMAWWLITVWHGIGALVIAWAVWGWFVRPMWMKRASTKAAIAAGLIPPDTGALAPGRQRAQWIYLAGLASACTLIAFLPVPGGISAPGIVGYGDPTTVRTACEGILKEVMVEDRQHVEAGDLIANLENPQLLVELADARLKHQASQEQANALRARGELAMLQAEQAKTESLASHIEQLEDRAAKLEIRAPCTGMLLMSLAEKIEGRFVKTGTPVCMIVSPQTLEVVASASQRDAPYFSQHTGKTVWVAATGSFGKPGKLVSVDSRGSEHCDQSALAARYSGPLPVEFGTSDSGEQELKYAAPRFVIKAALDSDSQHSSWIPGQLVWLSLSEHHERIWQWVARSFD